jgi:hypothetical protein
MLEREELIRKMKKNTEWFALDVTDEKTVERIAEYVSENGNEDMKERLQEYKETEDENLLYQLLYDIKDKEAEYALSVEKRVVFNVLLYTGGPAGGFELTCYEEGGRHELLYASFWHQDWFEEKQHVELPNDIANEIFEMYVGE